MFSLLAIEQVRVILPMINFFKSNHKITKYNKK